MLGAQIALYAILRDAEGRTTPQFEIDPRFHTGSADSCPKVFPASKRSREGPLTGWVIDRCRTHTSRSPELLYGVKKRCFWIARVEDHHPKRLGTTAVVARHLYVWRFHECLASLHGDRCTPL
jgi:hypothetical protein